MGLRTLGGHCGQPGEDFGGEFRRGFRGYRGGDYGEGLRAVLGQFWGVWGGGGERTHS